MSRYGSQPDSTRSERQDRKVRRNQRRFAKRSGFYRANALKYLHAHNEDGKYLPLPPLHREVFLALLELERNWRHLEYNAGLVYLRVSIALVASVANVSPRTVNRAYNRLKDCGWITTAQTFGWRGQKTVRVSNPKRERIYGVVETKTLPKGARIGINLIQITDRARERTGAPDPALPPDGLQYRRFKDHLRPRKPAFERKPEHQIDLEAIRLRALMQYERLLKLAPEDLDGMSKEAWMDLFVEPYRRRVQRRRAAAQARGQPPDADP